MNADGLPDAVVSSMLQAPLLVINGAGLALSPVPGAIPLGAAAEELELADLDVATASADGPSGDSIEQRILRNDGALAFAEVPGALGLVLTTCDRIGAGDVDRDGDADLVGSQLYSATRLFLGDGALGFVDATSPQPLGAAYPGVMLADLDRDGDMDAWLSRDAAQLHRNPGNGVFVPDPAATAGAAPATPGAGRHALALDANGDGAVDVYPCRAEPLVDLLFLGTGGGAFSLGALASPQSSWMSAAAGA